MQQYAVSRALGDYGVTPAAMIGHSLGDYCAATLAGVFSLSSALRVVALRGDIMDRMPDSGMLSVMATPAAVEPLLEGAVGLAAINAPELIVLSGPNADIDATNERLLAAGLQTRRVPIRAAAHSALLEPYLDEFRAHLSSLELNAPTLPIMCNATGEWLTQDQATDPDYWAAHLRHTVRFSEGLTALHAQDGYVFVEIGPGATLCNFLRDHDWSDECAATALLDYREGDAAAELADLRNALGRLWCMGLDVDIDAVGSPVTAGRHVPLPNTPFASTRHFIEPGAATLGAPGPTPDAAEEGGWLSRIGYSPQPLAASAMTPNLLTAAGADPAEQLDELLERWEQADRDSNPVLVWRLGISRATGSDDAALLARTLEVAQRLVTANERGALRLLLVSEGGVSVAGEATPNYRARMLDAAMRVVSHEAPDFRLRGVDLDNAAVHQSTDGLLAAEAAALSEQALRWHHCAYRDSVRYEEMLFPLDSLAAVGLPGSGTHYLVTGAAGEIAAGIVQWLLEHSSVDLTLMARRAPEPEPEWALAHAQRIHWLYADLGENDALDALRQRHAEHPISHVLHLAGSIDDALVSRKRPSQVAAVAAPKLIGTQRLAAALAEPPIEHFVNFSSTSALLGLEGQFDYAAANGWLDAWSTDAHPGLRRVSTLNWGPWRDLGMGFRLYFGTHARAIDHPVFDYEQRDATELRLGIVLSTARHWYLDGHRDAAGTAILPGAAYVSLLYAALRYWRPDAADTVHIEQLLLAQPCFVAESSSVPLSLILREEGSDIVVTFASFGDRAVHATARAALGDAAADATAAMPLDVSRPAQAPDNPNMEFGARWSCLTQLQHEDGRSVASLALDPQFTDDLASLEVHPALLDVAMTIGQELAWPAEGTLVPFSFENITIYQPFEGQISAVSHLLEPGSERFEVRLHGASGATIAHLGCFTMRAVPLLKSTPATAQGNDFVDFDHGIDLDGGIEYLQRILTQPLPRQLIVSAQPIAPLLEHAVGVTQTAEDPGDRHPRPELDTPYAAPAGDVEERLAALWADALAIADVGRDDNFFELGGHSLALTRLVAKTQSALERTLSIEAAFENPTIAHWGAVLSSSEAQSAPKPAKIGRIRRGDYKVDG